MNNPENVPQAPALCEAHTAAGNPCSAKGKSEYEGLCKTHYNQLERAREQERVRIEAEVQAQVALERERNLKRNRALQQNQQRVDQAPSGSIDTFCRYSRLIADMWSAHRIPGDLLAHAYCSIRRLSVKHAEWEPFIRAVTATINLAYFNPDELRWADIPQADKDAVFTALTNAMIHIPRYDIPRILKANDPVLIEFTRRRHEEREAERLAQVAQREAQRQAEFNHQQRIGPVVFHRDPEGGIDLAALGRDTQSVHRSSVQDATRKAVVILSARSVPADMEALVEITLAFNDTIVNLGANVKDHALLELMNDYYNTEAFNQMYGNILDRVWAYIRTHAERSELVRRLAQEVVGGLNMCVNGKMAHLVNVLYAYDEEITAVMQNETPPREIFQAKFATLLSLPTHERADAAATIFNEHHIPEAERAEWLNPLLEA